MHRANLVRGLLELECGRMVQHNPYAAPIDEVQEAWTGPAPTGVVLSLEQVLREAWRLNHGFKGAAFGATIVVGIVTVIAQRLFDLGFPNNYAEEGFRLMQYLTGAWHTLALLPLTAPLTAGVAMLALHRARALPATVGIVFSYFGKTWPLLLAGVLTSLMTHVGTMLLIIPGIYISVSLIFVPALIVDRNLGPLEAIATAVKTVHRRWFTVFGSLFVASLGLIVSLIPLGIGLIWTGPWFLLVQAVLYRSLFGDVAEGADPGMDAVADT